jgi:class 3 adenylate cyclase
MDPLPACPACGLKRPDPTLACPHCGAPAIARSEGARKSVAVLFADIVGSTSLIEGRDPEDAERLLRPARELAAACVRRYGGTVNRVTGDGIMALFGAPAALEDHVLAACCAAVAMHADLPATAPGIGLRVGIHAGEVMIHPVRADGAAGLDAAGDAVHLAARLQQAAAPDTTLISETVARAAGGRITAAAVPLLVLRGLSAPVAARTLHAVAPELTRLESAGAASLAPFVGRTEERMILAEAMAEARAGRGTAIGLVAEAGFGKSRLLAEFAGHEAIDIAVHQATCRRWREAAGFLPLQPLLRTLLLLEQATPPDAARARIEVLLAGLPPAARDADALAAVLDLPAEAAWRAAEPTTRRRRMIAIATAVLARLADAGPALLVVDDLHWADPETLAVLEQLADQVASLPLLLVLGFRPELDHTVLRHALLRVLPLGPLPPEDAGELAARLLPDATQAALLVSRAAGNPLFIETEAAARRAGEAGGPPPDTIRALLGTRIDRAGEAERQLLQAMAVHGEPASLPLLAELSGLAVAAAAASAEALAGRRLAAAEGIGSATALSCAHALIQEVVYADMTRAQRRVLHGRVLAALERHADGVADPIAETLARHARLAEDFPRLVRFARIAGRRAAARNANREAARFLEDALDALHRLPGADPALAVDLRFELRDPLFRLGRTADVRARLEEAGVFVELLGDAARLGQHAILLSHITWLGGDQAAASAAADRAAAIAKRYNDQALAVRVAFQRGSIALAGRAYDRAADLFAQVAAQFEAGEVRDRYGVDAPLAVVALSYQARALIEAGRLDEAAPLVARAEAVATQVNKPFTTVFALLARGHLLDACARSAEAVPLLEQAVALGELAESPLLEPVTTLFLGTALLHAGRRAEARAMLERSVAAGERVGMVVFAAERAARLAEAG